MVTSPKGLGPKKDYAGECQQHIQKTDPSFRHRGRPQKQGRNCQRLINIWSWAPDGCFIPRQTGRLTAGRNIRLRLRLAESSVRASMKPVHSQLSKDLSKLVICEIWTVFLWRKRFLRNTWSVRLLQFVRRDPLLVDDYWSIRILLRVQRWTLIDVNERQCCMACV
jgi:hypothetical protein